MNIRSATLTDAEGICEVHVKAIRMLCRGDYSAEQIEAWASPRRPGDYVAPISGGTLFVAERDERIAGFSEFKESTREICAVYVHPDFVRRGVGRALFSRLIAELRRRGIEEAWLDASVTSLAFYRALGCREVERQLHRLGSGVEIPCVRMVVPVSQES